MLKNLRSRNVFGYPRLKPVGEKRTMGFFITSQVSEGVHLNLKIFLPAVILMTILISIFFASCIPEPANAEEVDMDIIATIESNNNPNAVSYRGAKYGRGLCQVSEIVLKEFNDLYLRQLNLKEIENNYKEGITGEIIIGNRKLPFKEYDLFDVKINLVIANWYMNTRIPQMLKYYALQDTIDARLACYNAGIGVYLKYRHFKGKLPDETVKYIKKYHKLERQ